MMRYVIWPGGSALGRRLAAELHADLVADPALIVPAPRTLVIAPYGSWPPDRTSPLLQAGAHLLLLAPFPEGVDLAASACASHPVNAVAAGAQNRVRLVGPLAEAVGRTEARIAYQQVLETVLYPSAAALSGEGSPVCLLLQIRNTSGCLGFCTVQVAQPSGMTDAIDRRDLLRAIVEQAEAFPVAGLAQVTQPAGAAVSDAAPAVTALPLALHSLLNLALVALALEPEAEWSADRLASACEALTLAPVGTEERALLYAFLSGSSLLAGGRPDPARLEAALVERPALRSIIQLARKERLHGR